MRLSPTIRSARLTCVLLFPISLAVADSSQQKILDAYGKVPLSFADAAQPGDAIPAFTANGPGYRVTATSDSTVLVFGSDAKSQSKAELRLRVRGASKGTKLTAEDPLPGKVNYLIGQDSTKWRTGVATFGKVVYHAVLPGTDLVFHGRGQRLEYDFEVAPGADPAKIALELGDKNWKTRLQKDGSLVASSSDVNVTFDPPVAYQIAADGTHEIVPSRYRLTGNAVGFGLSDYDHSRKLVIDPIPVQIYTSMLGGTGQDYGYGIAFDRFSSPYVIGSTTSTNFPVKDALKPTCGTDGVCNGGQSDVFVTKFTTDGTGIIYSTYIGGSASDAGYGIAVDIYGYAYITGRTNSTDFPVTAKAPQAICGPVMSVNPVSCAAVKVSSCAAAQGGYPDAFAAKLTPDGTGLVYSTFLGGSLDDYGQAIAIDSAGNAYITGKSQSYTNIQSCKGTPKTYGFSYPASSGAYTPAANVTSGPGVYHAVMTKLNTNGGLVYSTTLGNGVTSGNSIGVDSAGNAYIGGSTTDSLFPTTGGVVQPSCKSCPLSPDGFISEINPSVPGAGSLVRSTFLGGSGSDNITGLFVDSTAHVYLTGNTTSNADYPTTAGVVQPASLKPPASTRSSAFATSLIAPWSSLYASTYLSGSDGDDYAFGLSVDQNKVSFIFGITGSSDFPLVNNTTFTPNGLPAPYILRLNEADARILPNVLTNNGENTYVLSGAVAMDPSNSVYLTGTLSTTPSTDFVTSTGAFQSVASPALGATATNNAYVQKIQMSYMPLIPSVAAFGPTQAVGTTSAPITIMLTNPAKLDLMFTRIVITGTNPHDFVETNTCAPVVPHLGGTCTFTVTFTPTAPGFRTAYIQLTDTEPGPQYIWMTGFAQ